MPKLSLSQQPELHDLIRAYLKRYYPEYNWDGISIEAEMTGEIIAIYDTAGIKPMFGQKAFLKFIFENQS